MSSATPSAVDYVNKQYPFFKSFIEDPQVIKNVPEYEIDILEEYLKENTFSHIDRHRMRLETQSDYDSFKESMKEQFPGEDLNILPLKTLTDKLWMEANGGENVPRTEKEKLKREIERLQNIIKSGGIGASGTGETITEPEPAGGEELMRLESENSSLQTENTRLLTENKSLLDNELEIKARLLELEDQLHSKSQETGEMGAMEQELEKNKSELIEAKKGLEVANSELIEAKEELEKVVDGVNAVCEMTARHKKSGPGKLLNQEPNKLYGGSRKRRSKRKKSKKRKSKKHRTRRR
jgi:hypothetical protein